MLFASIGKTMRSSGPFGIAVAGILFCLVCSLAAKQVGKFSYKGTPEDYTTPKFNGTVTVSDTMVAMAEKIRVTSKFITDSIMDTPSIFFIIDNSGSMSTVSTPNDRPGNRFIVTSAFIDTIFKKFPSAEIGYTAFKSILYFRAKDSPLFTALPMSYDPGGAYLPLYKLNGTYGGQTGISILKRFLETKQMTGSHGTYTDLVYTPSEKVADATNINVGFEAAKKALSASPRPKEKRYVVFLSDGDEHDIIKEPGYNPNYFQQGIDVPTTFTVYFTDNNKVPNSIVTMTANIQKNGYSSSNPKSQYWPFNNTDFNTLMSFLMTNVYSAIVTSKPAHPLGITVSGQTAGAWNQADSSFLFTTLFPLTGLVTPFNFQIKYPSKTSGDTVHNVNFNVKTQAGFAMPPADFEVKLWDRDIEFRYNNVPITVATGAMNQIDLAFPWNGGTANYKYTSVTIDLYNSVPPIDHETVTLIAGTNIFTGNFTRAASDTRTPGNMILEHAHNGDAVVAVFRNGETPKLPLDTLRITLNLTLLSALIAATTQDADGNGYLDHIVIAFDKAVDIAKTTGSSFTIQCNNVTFPVDSIVKLTDSTYSLCLKEQTQNQIPQTSWKPGITITGLPGVANAAGFIAADGAPPVVWTVVKQVVGIDDKTTDTVTVTLSEKISGKSGAPFAITNQPYQTFFVWIKGGVTFTKIDTMLAGITLFTKVLDDSILVFSMSNGHDLTADHWVNIQALQQLLSDKPGNFPTEVNQKVQVKVVYKIPASLLDSAVTRDDDGSGYLDRIELHFNKTTDIPKSAAASFTVRYGATPFPLDSIVRDTSRIYWLYLRQHAEPSPLETSWKPTISIAQVPGVADVTDRPALDGAAPVIWTAVKEIVDALDHKQDIVTVTMSEKVFAQGLVKFSLGNQPARTFNAWTKPGAVFTKVDAMFTGIVTFTRIPDDSSLEFAMTNGRNLTNSNWVNIQAPMVLCDDRNNFPTDLNRKVKVQVKAPPITITAFPNPSASSAKHGKEGELSFEHKDNALSWVYEDNAGTVISIKNVVIPGAGAVKGYIRIYDMVGNVVAWAAKENVFEGKDPGGTMPEFNIYWDGYNKAGTAVAPGIYRVVAHLGYPAGSEIRVGNLYTKIGIHP